MSDDLLDHVAAHSQQDPVLSSFVAREALDTAAECTLGVLGIGAYPKGDFEIPLPIVNDALLSENYDCPPGAALAPTARTWQDAFALCLASGRIWDRERAIGLLLRDDYAPAIREGVPYSLRKSLSDPADLVSMDALCGYLTEARGHLPSDWPTVPLRMPTAGERAEAARRLDALGGLSPDQRLLRVLLEDDPEAFEAALVERLVQYRESQPADAAPRSLLPLGTIALVALAVHVHGWVPNIRSGYLPQALLQAPPGAPRAHG
ncbi:immunity 49 family protein [Streptomyces yokosukanensis]|nr:immunity 49 family protein [Streptomyces yokosukanensis]